jgi:acetyl/propionyl-CoA carboxylase alpha subunit
VEHGITEMVNGNVDIVEWMLRLQLPHFLKPLDLATIETERSGWSIEVRGLTTCQHLGAFLLSVMIL